MIAVRKRHRFRFGMRTLLFLPVLVGGVWWWSTWPERTARRFVRLLAERDVKAAQSMLATPLPAADTALDTSVFDWLRNAERGEARFNSPSFQARSIVDWFAARGDFSVNADHRKIRIYYGGFTARRGFVQPNDGFERYTIIYNFRNADAAKVLEKIKSDFMPDFPMSIRAGEKGNHVLLMGSQEAHKEFSKLARRFDQKPGDVARSSENDSELVQ